ncbi:MAG: hypothetical protein JXR76_01790 [Deltaproteobacteria bacterium]|nr:hypothetical protein [Deltaproteobacteria bacterium]
MSLSHSHRRTEKQIRRLFARGLEGRSMVRLWKSLHECPSCAKIYERYSVLESALAGRGGTVSHFSVERAGQAIFGQLNEGAQQRRVRVIKWLAPVAGAVAATLVLLLLLPAHPASHRVDLSEVRITGMQQLAARGESRKSASYVGFRVFTVNTGDDGIGEKSRLDIGDTITFTYTYAKKEKGYMMLFGLQENVAKPLWYYPDYGKKRSISVAGDRVDEPLGDGIRLAVNHQEGPLRILSLFSKTPIQVNDVERAVLELRQTGQMLDVNKPLPLKISNIEVTEYSLLFNINGTTSVGATK